VLVIKGPLLKTAVGPSVGTRVALRLSRVQGIDRFQGSGPRGADEAMGKYIAILRDRCPARLTREMYHRHIDYLRGSARNGALILAGPLKDQDRVLQILQAESREAAERILAQDPFVSDGYFRAYELYELIESNEGNNWLQDTPRVQELLRGL
jgi:uncharacterized protein YciI